MVYRSLPWDYYDFTPLVESSLSISPVSQDKGETAPFRPLLPQLFSVAAELSTVVDEPDYEVHSDRIRSLAWNLSALSVKIIGEDIRKRSSEMDVETLICDRIADHLPTFKSSCGSSLKSPCWAYPEDINLQDFREDVRAALTDLIDLCADLSVHLALQAHRFLPDNEGEDVPLDTLYYAGRFLPQYVRSEYRNLGPVCCKHHRMLSDPETRARIRGRAESDSPS